ncbi:hypothetical protein AVEN_169659-1 [Araneus ventricosus]|uniref:Uncharacterized protein n=1 Tax=Araneus ventricosus TaxID=182803 RepID=A0A4Y2D477_ARAVE|nr:hypothetical protein AVEN_169659-1 [Araneus ventricosus]
MYNFLISSHGHTKILSDTSFSNTTSHADDRPPTELFTEQSCAAPSTAGNSSYIVQFLTIYCAPGPIYRELVESSVEPVIFWVQFKTRLSHRVSATPNPKKCLGLS